MKLMMDKYMRESKQIQAEALSQNDELFGLNVNLQQKLKDMEEVHV